MASPLTITSYDELISAIPHMLGFQPVDSMVCLAVGGGPTARLDLPTSLEELGPWLETLTEVYLRPGGPGRVALVAFGEDGRTAVGAIAALSEALASGPEVGPLLWVRGDEWTELATASRGTISSSARARIDAEFALVGRIMPARSRADLAAGMRGNSADVAGHLPQTRERFEGLDPAAKEAERGWVAARIELFLEERSYVSDLDAVRVLVAIKDPAVQDAAALAMKRDNAALYSELWQDLSRRAPSEVRDAPLSLLALSSWLEGHGAKAWSALDQVSRPNRLAELVAAAQQQALDPRSWDTAAPGAMGALLQHSTLGESRGHGLGHHPESSTNPDQPSPGMGR